MGREEGGEGKGRRGGVRGGEGGEGRRMYGREEGVRRCERRYFL